MSFAAITLCVASQQVFIVVSVSIDSVRKLLDTPGYVVFSHSSMAKSPLLPVVAQKKIPHPIPFYTVSWRNSAANVTFMYIND
jgi:hypothetical protein